MFMISILIKVIFQFWSFHFFSQFPSYKHNIVKSSHFHFQRNLDISSIYKNVFKTLITIIIYLSQSYLKYVAKIYNAKVCTSLNLFFFFLFDGPLKLPDFIAVEISLWWSDKPVSNVLKNLNTFDLLKCVQCSLGCVNSYRCVNLWAHLNWTVARACPRGHFQYS